MKKILCVLLCACLLGGSVVAFSGCTPRDQKLLIRNWGEYMPESVYKGFETWYKNLTGKNIKVEYDEYDGNETLYTQLAVGGYDFDLVCPSDYMIERMIREDMLQPLSDETLEIVSDAIDPFVKEFSRVFDADFEYTMPYLWGTLGIMYNTESGYNDDIMSSWSVLFDNQYKNKVYMKDSPRDVYTVAMLYKNSAGLLKAIEDEDQTTYDSIMDAIFENPTNSTINIAKNTLSKQKSDNLIKGYDFDMAKDEMLKDTNGTDKTFGMFWSCDAGYVMNGDDDEGNNRNLRYIVPEEGGNVWIDGFVIPKNAGNSEAANLFIQYLCDIETGAAYDCMDYAGTTTAIKDAADEYKAELIEDFEEGGEFFEGADQAFYDMYMDMMFPSETTLARCRMMRDFDEFNDSLFDMWENVKNS